MKSIKQLEKHELIHARTKEEADAICGKLHQLGYKWRSGESYSENSRFHNDSTERVYNFHTGRYGFVSTYPNCILYTIDQLSDFGVVKLENTPLLKETPYLPPIHLTAGAGIKVENAGVYGKPSEGLRFNEGKLRYDLVHPHASEGLVRVLTKGSQKYTEKWESEWEKLLIVANAVEIKLSTAKECVVHVMKNNSGKIILNTQKDKGLILRSGRKVTEKEKENWIKLEEVILNLEKEIKEHSGEYVSENLILQNNPTMNYVKKVVKYAEEQNTFTLTTTIKQDYSEESYVVNATTVSECLEMMKKVLEKHLNISFQQHQLKNKGERNWERGMSWSTVIASLKRHLAAIEKGEDYDSETGELHADHLQCNAHFLSAYYKIYPQGDDRPHKYLKPVKIGLDIDEVICDWIGNWSTMCGIPTPTSWKFDRGLLQKFETMKSEGKLDEFYSNLKPLIKPEDIPFEPFCYITSRPVDSTVTEAWLNEHGFPAAPVHTVGAGKTKVDVAKEQGIDIFVDDNFDNFVALNNAGICCFLMDAPHNQRYDVGYRRIKSLKEVL